MARNEVTEDDHVFGVNLVKGVELVEEFVQNKRAFWRFPMEVVHTRDEFEDFLAEMIGHNELIEALSLSNASNMFRFGGVRLMKTVLFCDIIKVLELRSCSLNNNPRILKSVIEFISMTPTCSCIDLSGNHFNTSETEKITLSLIRNSVVLEFVFRDNGLKNAACGLFKTMIRGNDHLESLDLSNNPFGPDGERILEEGVRGNDTLKVFEYKHIKTKSQGIREKLRANKLNWRQQFIKNLKKEETGKWNRSKLMFIGQGRAGKTSTVNRLLSKGFDASQDSTVGASVSQTQTSTTQEQQWKTVNENDPEYLGTGMIGNQAGQLFAARNMVSKGDEAKKKALQARKQKGVKAGKANRLKRVQDRMNNQENQGDVAVGLSEAAHKLLLEQQERDEAANKLFIEQERLRQAMENIPEAESSDIGQIMTDEEMARRLQAQEEEELRRAREERARDDDTAKHYADTVFAAAREKRDTITFSLWDYGGQAVFYALHHLFLTKYGVYVLCVDLTEILERPAVAREYLSFWLNSVKLHAPTAPVLLVGTHLDSLEENRLEQLAEVNQFVKDNFSERYKQLASLHPKYSFYPVDNKNNKGVNELRFDVERISRKQEFVTADVSIKWMFCLDKIMVKRDTGGRAPAWMKLTQVKHFAESVKISSHEELERMLTMFHELGVLVRLTGTEELRNLITLDPQWLLDGLCKVIRDERLHGPSEKELEKVGLTEQMDLLYRKGIASEDVLRYLWSEDKFKDHQNYLIDLMKHMVLISDWDFREEKMYVIPSLLIPRPEDLDLFDNDHLKLIEEEEKKDVSKRKIRVKKLFGKGNKKKQKKEEKAPKAVVKEEQEEEEEEVLERTEETEIDYIIFDFSKVFLPMGVFQRLVCMCVSYSTNLGKKKKLREPELYARWAKIWMGNDTVLFLEQKDDTIWLSVEDLETGPTCFKAVNSMLQKLNADLMGSGLDWIVSMQKVKRTVHQKKGEKPEVTIVTEYQKSEADAKKEQLQPWYKRKEAAEVATSKQEEMLDLENFVDAF